MHEEKERRENVLFIDDQALAAFLKLFPIGSNSCSSYTLIQKTVGSEPT
jgi:hypothetical protein